MELKIKNIGLCFIKAREQGKKYVGVKIQMEGFPKPEIIINGNENFHSKFAYISVNIDVSMATSG